jgi:hypothetical protein
VARIVREASPEAVLSAATRLSSRLTNEIWLASNSRYLSETDSKLSQDIGRRTSVSHARGSAKASHLAEYVAASAILHCSDGWGYLGRAMAAQLQGDIGASRHLAYYAELRAAMSLLAAQGVGVFNYKQVVVRASDDVDVVKQKGTHRFTWEALSAWSDLPASAAAFAAIIRPADVPLSEWLEPLTSTSVTSATGRSFLLGWGLDVERFGLDRDARNESSYQPRTLRGARAPSSSRAAEFGRDFWDLFQPEGAGKFGRLDRYLLRRTLERLFESQKGKTVASNPKEFEAYVKQAVGAVQPTIPCDQLQSFLTRAVDPDDPTLLDDAEAKSRMEDPEDHLQVMARAALLLRGASGFARKLLEEANLSYPEYEWWAAQIAACRALTQDQDKLETPDDLWADIGDAIVDLDAKITDGEAATYMQLHESCARELALMGGCERIALWSLAA